MVSRARRLARPARREGRARPPRWRFYRGTASAARRTLPPPLSFLGKAAPAWFSAKAACVKARCRNGGAAPVGASQAPGKQPAFVAGAALASFLCFAALGYGARLLAPLFARPGAWWLLDAAVGATMLATAAGLVAW